jgi:hypothetical protein
MIEQFITLDHFLVMAGTIIGWEFGRWLHPRLRLAVVRFWRRTDPKLTGRTGCECNQPAGYCHCGGKRRA